MYIIGLSAAERGGERRESCLPILNTFLRL